MSKVILYEINALRRVVDNCTTSSSEKNPFEHFYLLRVTLSVEVCTITNINTFTLLLHHRAGKAIMLICLRG